MGSSNRLDQAYRVGFLVIAFLLALPPWHTFAQSVVTLDELQDMKREFGQAIVSGNCFKAMELYEPIITESLTSTKYLLALTISLPEGEERDRLEAQMELLRTDRFTVELHTSDCVAKGGMKALAADMLTNTLRSLTPKDTELIAAARSRLAALVGAPTN